VRELLDGSEAARVAEVEALTRNGHYTSCMQTAPVASNRDPDHDLHVIEPLCAVFRRYLKSLNQKYTPERAQVLDVLFRLDDLFQADQLLEEVRKSGQRVSKATVYRTIKLLQEAGIIQQVLLQSEQAHYQLVYGRRPRDLLIRLDTHEIIPIEVPELAAIRDRICREHGVRAQSHRLKIFAVGDT